MLTSINPNHPRVGDTGWMVEWVTELGWVDPADHTRGMDPDAHKYRRRRVATREEAVALAREVFPADQMGAVTFWPVEFVAYYPEDAERFPEAGHWRGTGEEEYYEEDGR